MKRNQMVPKYALLILILLLPIGWQEQSAADTEMTTEALRAPKAVRILPEPASASSEPLPRISFEKTVFDLGEVGQGTKNTCESKFTNTGRGLLKIGNISRTCACTVFHLDKKEYPPNETGTIKVIYTAGRSKGTTQKSIYVPKASRQSYLMSF